MADIRGRCDKNGLSPFWQHLASKFIGGDYETADRLSALDGHFIRDLLPELPISLNLLPEAVSICAGRPNDHSVGALKLLRSAGFRKTDLCDAFDGGPALACATDETLVATTAVKMTDNSENLSSYNRPNLAFTGSDPANRQSTSHKDRRAHLVWQRERHG